MQEQNQNLEANESVAEPTTAEDVMSAQRKAEQEALAQQAAQAPRPKQLQIELIPKQSTYDDVKEFWKARGGSMSLPETGSFFFPKATEFSNRDGVITIVSNGEVFIYNVSDFYRIKVTPIF